MSVATFNKSGTFPPLAFRKVAILLMFTLNFVIGTLFDCDNTYLWVQKYKVKLRSFCLFLIILHEISRIAL
jgi:hypothetical protein